MSAYGTSRSESLERAGTSTGPLMQIEDDMTRNRPPTKPKYVYRYQFICIF